MARGRRSRRIHAIEGFPAMGIFTPNPEGVPAGLCSATTTR
jgi:hypothetical protein